MIFRFSTKILEDRLFPVSLHMIPIIYHPMSDRIMYSIARSFGICESLVADEEIEVFDTSFGG